MELCTPAVSRTYAGEGFSCVEHMGMSTPAAKRAVGTVPPCTPAETRMEMCTPAVSRGKETTPRKELCTPSDGSDANGEVQGMPLYSPLNTPILIMEGKGKNIQNGVKEEENKENHVEELGNTTFLALQLPIRGFKC